MINIIIDSNILVSAILNNQSVPYQSYKKAVEPPYQGMICEQILEEYNCNWNTVEKYLLNGNG